MIRDGRHLFVTRREKGLVWQHPGTITQPGDAAGAWFLWTTVGMDAVHVVAATAALRVRELWSAGDEGRRRWFAVLVKC